MSTDSKVVLTPNCRPSRAVSATSAACSSALVGMHPMCRQVPPRMTMSNVFSAVADMRTLPYLRASDRTSSTGRSTRVCGLPSDVEQHPATDSGGVAQVGTAQGHDPPRGWTNHVVLTRSHNQWSQQCITKQLGPTVST